MRQLVLPVLLASFVTVGCNSGGNSGNMGGKDAGTGGNGGAGGSGGGEDMAKAPPPPDMAMADPIMWPDPGTLPPATKDPTEHPPEPRLMSGKTVGGTATGTMKAPMVYVVTWEGDEALGKRVSDFTNFFVKSDFWVKSMAEYGVGAGGGAQLVVLPGPPPATISQLFGFDQYVTAALTKAGVSTPDGNTLVSFVIDMNQKVTDLTGAAGNCTQFGGYHIQTGLLGGSGPTVSYTVAALCPGADGVTPDYNDLTVSQSHEVEEAASDPLPQTTHINSAANIIGGGEIGDNCLNVNYALKDAASGNTYMVQRVYSDKNALAGNVDPCLINDGPFFGVGVWSGDTAAENTVTIARAKQTDTTASTKFTLQPFSYDPSVDQIEYSIVGSTLPPGVSISPDIARRADPAHPGQVLGMRAFGKPGAPAEFTVTVDYSKYQKPQTVPNLIVFARTKTGYISVWWSFLSIK